MINLPASPIDKLRETLQERALLGLARHHFFEHAAFYGGTALRILYGLDRYSEDLDFSLLKPNRNFDFSPFIQGMNKELQAMGFNLEVEVRKPHQDSSIRSAFLKANTLTLLLLIEGEANVKGIHPEQKIQIKLEIDTDPPDRELPLESKLISTPVPFYVVTYQLPDLFAGKMHAALCRAWQKRIKGRDWYDVIWYIKNNVPLHLEYLSDRMHQTKDLPLSETLSSESLLQWLKKRIDAIDWELARKDVEPFIEDKRQLDIWSSTFFHDLILQLRLLQKKGSSAN